MSDKTKKDLLRFMAFCDDPDLSEGDWERLLKDAVEVFNDRNGTSYDADEAFREYVDQKTKKQQG